MVEVGRIGMSQLEEPCMTTLNGRIMFTPLGATHMEFDPKTSEYVFTKKDKPDE